MFLRGDFEIHVLARRQFFAIFLRSAALKLPCPRGDRFPYMYIVKTLKKNFFSELTKARG
jgi:hypothetical protein